MPSGIFTLKQQELALGQGAWTNQKPLAVDYLVVAGGGGGGGNGGAGGGAGGLLQGNLPIATGSAITVTVGGGGSGGGNPGANGSNSVFGAITSIGGGGGGYGASPSTAGSSGGSGGGGAGYNGTQLGGQGVFGQGNKGGDGINTGTNQFSSAGGGGAGTVGFPPPTTTLGGNGGSGIASDISGTRTTYAGGGAGGGNSFPTNYGAGGAGGGGGASGVNGTASTGGGASANGNGGSGIVIISYPDTYAAPASTTGSPVVSTSGSGSVAFSGTGQYLSTPSNNGFNFGTGDFTIECWFNSNDVGATQRGFFQTSDTAGGLKNSYLTGVALLFSGGATGSISANVGGTFYNSSGSAVTTGTWYHIALTRQSGTVNLWLNGTSVASGSGNTANLSGTYCAVGGYFNTSYLLNGNLSNVRVVKGTAVYTASFTPSATPLTAITNTQLLLSTVSGSQFADSSANSLILTATGAPSWNQLSPFATGLGYKNRVYTWTSSGSITF